jgi:hypothetical protein
METNAMTYTTREHDWQVPPTEWRYDGRPLAEFSDDAMGLAHERVRLRFGGDLPRDVSLALNDAFRRGMRAERERIAEDFERISGDRSPALTDDENRWHSTAYAAMARRVRNPEQYSGCAERQDAAKNPNEESPPAANNGKPRCG